MKQETNYEYCITKFLDEKNMSQAQLARLSGVSSSSLNRYVNGDDMPISKAKRIADALNVTVDELLGINFGLSRQEEELIEYFRSMSPRFRAILMDSAQAMAENGLAKNNDNSGVA